MLTTGKAYKRVDGGRFPFDNTFGIFVEETPRGWLRFVCNGKDMLLNGGEFEEISAFIEKNEDPNIEIKIEDKQEEKEIPEFVERNKAMEVLGKHLLEMRAERLDRVIQLIGSHNNLVDILIRVERVR